MTMVPFPVEFPMPRNVQQNDLVYESSHIGTEGPAMTHSMLAIDWLQMGNKTAGDAEFVAAYNTNLVGSFMHQLPDRCRGFYASDAVRIHGLALQ
jgi:hypothetical protein